MKVMPSCKSKQIIRKYIYNVCLDLQPSRVFTLVGDQAGFAKMLPKEVTVVSAEYHEEVLAFQLKNFPRYKHYDSIISAMDKEEPFKVIWLDYFGNCTLMPRLIEIGAAINNLEPKGMLFITSLNRRNRSVKHSTFIQNMYSNFPKLKIKSLEYNNNGHPMILYSLYKK